METWLAWGFGEGSRRKHLPDSHQIPVCGLQPQVSLSLCLGFPLSLSLPVSHSLLRLFPSPFSLIWSSFLDCPVSKSLSLFLSPGPSIFLTPPLSASTSVCPSLSVLVHLSVSLRLPVCGCLCPSVLPPICLVVCASPSKSAHLLPKAPSPRSAKASPGSGGGEGVRSCSFWKLQ